MLADPDVKISYLIENQIIIAFELRLGVFCG
jgi:hypothetical protein